MKLLSRSLFTPAFALVLSMASPVFAQDAISLKQQWQVGKRYFQTMSMDQSMELNMGGIAMNQKSALKNETIISVTPHEDGKRKRLTFTFGRMTMDMDMGGQKISIDSAKPDEAAGPLGNPFAKIAGKEIRAILGADNKVSEFENLDELFAGMSANPLAGAFVGKDALGRLIEQGSMAALPDHPVKPGDSWPFKIEMPMPQLGKVTISGTYTFKGIAPHNGQPCAEIAVSGSLTMGAGAAGSGPMASMGLKAEGSTMTGTIWFDNALGMAQGSVMEQSMNMTMKDPTDPTKTVSMPIKQNIHTELTKVETIK